LPAPQVRQVRWKAAIVEHWPHIIRAHGMDPSPRTVIRHIRAQDKSGDILSHDVADELKWRTESGAHKVVKLKTFRNALSELRAQGLLRH
jgi:hypothetical protein